MSMGTCVCVYAAAIAKPLLLRSRGGYRVAFQIQPHATGQQPIEGHARGRDFCRAHVSLAPGLIESGVRACASELSVGGGAGVARGAGLEISG